MSRRVVMFPGQGSQHLGMGREVFDRYPELCARADGIVGYRLSELCLEDPDDRLGQTSCTQQAIYFVSCLMYLDYAERHADGPPRCVLGHSLGLYPALFAVGVLDLFEGLDIVSKRGELMQKAHGGSMLGVIGSHVQRIEDHLDRLEFFDVDVANYNSPDQVVVSAAAPRLDELAPHLEEAGYRCVRLPVSGAFHSRHMEPCRREFARYLLDREFAEPTGTVVSTTSGQVLDGAHLLEEMVFQLVKPVRWWQTVTHVARTGPATFDEVGPGTVLTKLNAKIFGGRPSSRT